MTTAICKHTLMCRESSARRTRQSFGAKSPTALQQEGPALGNFGKLAA